MNFKYLIIGMLFLLNPNINVIDILPDFIGYAFIIRGMMKYSSLCEDFRVSYSSFKILLWLNIAKLPFLLFYLSLSESTRIWMLVLTVCFGIFDIFFGIKAFGGLFDALAYCAMRTGDDSNADSGHESTLSKGVFDGIDFLKKFTLIFICLKTVLCVLPELTLLSSENYGEVTSDGIISIARFRPFFIAAAAIAVLAIGIYWYIKIRAYFLGVKADVEYNALLEERFSQLEKEDEFESTKKRLFFAFSMLTLGFVLFSTINADGFDYVPKALGGAMFAVACFTLTPLFAQVTRSAFKKCILFCSVSGAIWIYQICFVMSFFKNQLFSNEIGLAVAFPYALEHSIQRSFTTYYLFIGSIILSVVEAVFTVLLMLAMKRVVFSLINTYTGVASLRLDTEEAIRETSAVRASLTKLLNVTVILGIITAVTSSLQIILCIVFPSIWLADAVARALFVILGVVLIAKIKDAVKAKYFIE